MDLNELLVHKLETARPLVVCHVGSTTAACEAFEEWRLKDTLAGHIVLTIGAKKNDTELQITPDQAVSLDVLHLYKIDLADFVRVLNVQDYIGQSTKREIAYATQTGKPCVFLTKPAASPTEPCYVCGSHITYVDMGNGEETALPGCAYCDRVTCLEHSFIDESGHRCCYDPYCLGGECVVSVNTTETNCKQENWNDAAI
ncbi:MAG: hypothetical protein JO202_01600 [Ktedonobacteraceae bacterium]|nr:hypothetical protein [Ktedonobacteraceae bacterium]